MSKNCIVCGNRMNQKTDWVYQCGCCGFWHSSLKPGGGRGIEGLEHLRRANFKIICNQLEKQTTLSGKTLLEVGCAEGWFLDEARQRGAKVLGIEPSNAAEIALKSGHEVLRGFFPDVIQKKNKFDIIIFNDVFEHLPDPVTAVQHCSDHLTDGGILILNLPSSHGVFYNIARLMAKFGFYSPFERLWQKGFASPHITYFNEKTLSRFIANHSNFEELSSFSLPSIVKDGLQERIQASHKGLSGSLLYACILLLLPVINNLPNDIFTAIFKKPFGEK